MAGSTQLRDEDLSVRANWFSGAQSPTDEAVDPFADMTGTKSSIALSVDSSIEEITARLATLLRREGRLAEMGISCPLKASGECNCSACPVSQLNHPEEAISALCRVGMEQERAVMLSLAKTNGLLGDGGR